MNSVKNRQKSSEISISLLKKGALKLRWAATIKPRQIERSTEPQRTKSSLPLVYGQPDERLWRKRDFEMKDNKVIKVNIMVS